MKKIYNDEIGFVLYYNNKFWKNSERKELKIDDIFYDSKDRIHKKIETEKDIEDMLGADYTIIEEKTDLPAGFGTESIESEEDKDLYEIVRNIESPYDRIGKQMERDPKIKELLKDNINLEEYDLNKMIPKVTYDLWSVCLYEEDNKLYYIDEVIITEVEPIEILLKDKKYNTYFDEHGTEIFVEDIIQYISDMDYLCCGEADDMKSYIVFNDFIRG